MTDTIPHSGPSERLVTAAELAGVLEDLDAFTDATIVRDGAR